MREETEMLLTGIVLSMAGVGDLPLPARRGRPKDERPLLVIFTPVAFVSPRRDDCPACGGSSHCWPLLQVCGASRSDDDHSEADDVFAALHCGDCCSGGNAQGVTLRRGSVAIQ